MSRNQRLKRPVPPSANPSTADISAALNSLPSRDPKKPRFDTRNPRALAADDEDDRDIFLEVDDGAVNQRGKRRGNIELEGYDTDSSEEGFDATRKIWKEEDKGKAKADDDGDEDMFAGESEDDDDARREKDAAGGDEGKKKGVKFLDLHEIEGQEFSSRKEYLDIIDEDRGKGDDADEDIAADEEEVDEEIGRGGSKKHAPKIDAFNMEAEMEEGRFDEEGNFIRRKKEKDAVHDNWLEGVSRKDMVRAREAMEKRERDKREEERRRDEIVTADILAQLIPCLEVGESVLEGLARLGGGRKKKQELKKGRNVWREKKKAERERKVNDGMDGVEEKGKGKQEEVDPEERRRKELVEKVTEAADMLLTRGQIDIYDATREELMRQYRRETGEDFKMPEKEEEMAVEEIGEKLWEFRWADGHDGQVHGPYKNSEMKAWSDHGFFAAGAEFREKDGGDWTSMAEF